MQTTKFKRWVARGTSASVLSMLLVMTTASAGQALLDATFESGLDGFGARASETVEGGSKAAYEGDYCLKVSKRGNAWNGPVYSLGTDWVSGESYGFSCAVKQDSGETVKMQLSIQYDTTSTTYDQIVSAEVPSGEWTVLSNASYTIPAGATSRSIYVETVESLCDFYVDSVKSTAPSHYRKGDVNHDDAIDKKDLNVLLNYLLTKNAGEDLNMDTADMNADGRIDVRDFSMLKQLFIYPELTRTTTTTTTTTTPPPQVELKPGQWNNTADVSWINGRKTVALSFDDGPVQGDNANRIHAALKKSGFHATFFYWGSRIQNNPNEIKAAEAAGFEVANHTWSHPDNLDKQDANGVMSEYNKCKDALNQVLGVNRDYLVRLPYLKVSDTIRNTLPVPCPNCGIDSSDWAGASTDAIVQKIQQAAQNGSLNGQVVLMHETEGASVAAVEKLCPWLEQNGYAVVTVSEMFKVNGKDMWAGHVYNSIRDN